MATETMLEKIEELRSQLNVAAELAAKNWCRRFKARWIEKGECSTKYFYAHYKAKKTVSCLDSVKIPESVERSNTLEYIRDFYEELYKSEEICQESFRMITSDLPQVDNMGNDLLTQKITREEIYQTMLSLPNNKSPGTDGLTYEFYKIFADKIAPILEEVFNKVLLKGKMPLSWHKNMIILIPKKEENLEEIGNWRPNSLVNSDAKIFMKILAGRLNIVCKDIIAIHQQGFISGRLITDAVLDILTTLRSHRESSDQYWLLLIDQAKAFDRVNHDYLKGVLKKINFHAQFI